MNLGTGNGYSVEKIIDSVSKITKKTINKKYEKRRVGDPPKLVACGELAKKHLGWFPKYSDIDTIIRSGWNWYNKKCSDNSSYE